MADVETDFGARLSRVETFVAELHWSLIGQFRSQLWQSFVVPEEPLHVPCPSAQDLVVSPSKRRRIRAAKVRNRLWIACVQNKKDLFEDHSVASASFCSYAESSERDGCSLEAVPADADPTVADDNSSTKQQHLWTSQEMSDWVRNTLRLANERCAEEMEDQKDKQQCLEARSQVVLERWATAKQYFPATLHEELLQMLLDEPRR